MKISFMVCFTAFTQMFGNFLSSIERLLRVSKNGVCGVPLTIKCLIYNGAEQNFLITLIIGEIRGNRHDKITL